MQFCRDMLFPESFTDAMIARAQSAAAGDADAQFQMAQMYRLGKGVPVNLQEAIFWYERACKGGNSRSGYELAQLYLSESDFDKAHHWHKNAATAGQVPSMVALGNFFARGVGVTKDLKVAADWYGRAARHGNASAQFVFGLMLRDGRGVDVDRIAAFVWIGRAIDSNLPAEPRTVAIAARQALLNSMSSAEQIRANALAEADRNEGWSEGIEGVGHDSLKPAQSASAA